MATVAPKGRKHLSADALFRLVQTGFDTIPEHRLADPEIALTDALMSACAMVSLKSPSLLAFDKERAEGNLAALYGIERVPCDTRRREIRDPLSPAVLRPLFQSGFRQLQRGKALEPMAFLEDSSFVALDGTGSFSSKTIHGASCLHKVHRNGSHPYSHQMVGAAILHPDVRAVIPLMPEPIGKHDGTAKNDGERNAANRFLATLRQDHPHLKFLVTEDSLSSKAPHIETLHTHGVHDILGVKEKDHTSLFQQVQAAAHLGGVTSDERHDRTAGLVPRCRFVNAVPLNASNAAIRVNFIADWDMGADRLQHLSGVTDIRVSQRHVYPLMRGGRARWKIENETFNTLKNQGDNFEHNDGHGTHNRSVVFAVVMMLAFLVDPTQQLCCALFRAVWAKLGSKRLLWERRRALFYGSHLESMRALWEALWYGYERHRPLWLTNTS